MSMLSEGMSFLSDTSLRCMSTTISYNGNSVSAVVGSTLFRITNEYGVTVTSRCVDFLIHVNAIQEEPKKGDSIVFSGRTYEVLAPNNEPVWRWINSNQDTYRIHTKEV